MNRGDIMTTYLVNGLGCCFGEELEGDKD